MQIERERSNDTDVELPNKGKMPSDECPLMLEDAIRNGQEVSATDASIDGTLMATHWIIKSFEHQKNIGRNRINQIGKWNDINMRWISIVSVSKRRYKQKLST